MTLGSPPFLFWQPWLGANYHLRPCDMHDIFVTWWLAMYDAVKKVKK